MRTRIGDREADGRDKDGARISVDRARQRIVEPAGVIGSEELIVRLAPGVAVGSLYLGMSIESVFLATFLRGGAGPGTADGVARTG
jgi:hypothetical protein